jgi:hypothetical protein
MGVPSTAPPPPGTVGVGELLADAQTKTLWLGVPTTISAQQSVLISDLVGLQDDMVALRATIEAELASGLATKSNVGHHHVISDIDGLDAALSGAGGLPVGCIVLWSGTLGTIPGGWALCNGSNGTPDLRDRFIMGGGGSMGTTLSTGGSNSTTGTTGLSGGHTPTGLAAATILTAAMIPPHTHPVTDPGHIHAINDPGHIHNITTRNQARMDSNSQVFTTIGGGGTSPTSSGVSEETTGITVVAHSTGISIGNNTGGGGGHTHVLTMDPVAGHTHSLTIATVPAYIILGYIMKV